MIELLDLFISFVKVGSFSFGGAYSLIPLIEKECVQNNHWLTHDEFLKVLGMVEVFPGAISIKFATYTGFKVGGVLGAVVANLGNLIMPATIIMLAAYFMTAFEKNDYVMKAFRGIKYAVIGMIVALIYQYAVRNFEDWKGIIFMLVGFGLIFAFKLHPAYVVIISGILALVLL
ncbi:MAG: chromate transporter [Ignavibacteriae bacterium HGW-Ignavibacteriae-2]|jgi:chromate transporter|nr:MAG: chromate transporter [Ignavibacteriae bacterium HGW-Ignavibacteriae-2]